MSMWLRQSTSVVVQFGPFLDKTDGVTLETAIAAATLDHLTTGIMISKNGGTLAVRNGTPTASAYDAHGMYKITLNTTDTGTLGTLRMVFTDAATHLPVWQDFMVVPANVWDSMFGADALQVDTIQVGGTTQTARDLGASVLLSSGTGAGQISLSSGLVTLAGVTHTGAVIPTVTTNTDMRGTDNAALASTFTGITSLAEWLGLLAGKQVGNATARTELRATGAGAGTYDETTDSLEASQAEHDVTQSALTTIDDFLDTEIADILTDTGTTIPAQISALNNISAANVLTQVNAALDTAIAELAQATPTATPTLRTGLMLLYMMARNKLVCQTSGTDAIEVYNDAGTLIAKKLVTDDGADYTEAEMVSGP